MQISISLIASIYGAPPRSLACTWLQLVSYFETPVEVPTKDTAPMWSPCTFREGGGRTLAEAREISCGVIDLDKVPLETVREYTRILREMGISALIHSTYTHSADTPKFRIIFPLAQPVPAKVWPSVWRKIAALFPGLDGSCKDASRAYYLPAVPTGKLSQYVYQAVHGAPMDVTTLAPSVSGTVAVSAAMLLSHGKSLIRKGRPEGERLCAVAQGHAFATEGERDTWIYRLTSEIAKQWPDLDPVATAALFAPSLSHGSMGGGSIPVSLVADKLRRHVAQRAAVRTAGEDATMEELTSRCRDAFRGVTDGRDYPYTDEEIRHMQNEGGLSQDPLAFARRWIVQEGTTFFIRGPRGYVATAKEAAAARALTELAPAITAGVELYRVTEKGRIPFTIGELMGRYGSVSEGIELSLTDTATHYDEPRRKMVLAPCPLAPLEPRYDYQIAEWLRLLAGPLVADLEQWLGYVTELSVPCSALFLAGPGGTGKSLFASGLAALWGRRMGTQMESISGAWTEEIANCPLIVAEERLPQTSRGGFDLSWFRDLIQARTRPFRKKYFPEATITGCVRVVIAAQHIDVMKTSTQLRQDDIDAIAERITTITVSARAREYLATIPTDTLSMWAREGIACHALALRGGRRAPQGRFIVRVDSCSAQRQLATMSGLGASIPEWIVTTVCKGRGQPMPRAYLEGRGLYLRRGQILVHAQTMAEQWSIVFGGEPRPRVKALALALAPISTERLREGTSRVRVYAIDPEVLMQFAEDAGEDQIYTEELQRAMEAEK